MVRFLRTEVTAGQRLEVGEGGERGGRSAGASLHEGRTGRAGWDTLDAGGGSRKSLRIFRECRNPQGPLTFQWRLGLHHSYV